MITEDTNVPYPREHEVAAHSHGRKACPWATGRTVELVEDYLGNLDPANVWDTN